MTRLSDSWNRPVNYLRISVTDRCNLRCAYCMPSDGVHSLTHDEILSYEEIAVVAKAASELGISKVRITGGEPLVRLYLDKLVAMLAEIPAIDDISLTTNGVLLSQYAAELKHAGLKRVNISLDSLNRAKFEQITRHDSLDDVLRSIAIAKSEGLNPVKINMVVMKGINDSEILDFAKLTVTEGWHVRFIEFMPFGTDDTRDRCYNAESSDATSQFVSIDEVQERLNQLGPLEPSSLITGNGPARYYRLPNATGTIGFISPVSQHFCFKCNRLRVTADGKLRPCLLSDEEIDLRSFLRTEASTEKIKETIADAVQAKPQKHALLQQKHPKKRFMSQVGG